MPDPYTTFTFDKPYSFPWSDRHGTIHKFNGDSIPLYHACDALNFVYDVPADIAYDGDIDSLIDILSIDCGIERAVGASEEIDIFQEIIDYPFSEPAPVEDPTSPRLNLPPGSEGETSETLGAPQSETQGTFSVESRAPGDYDGRPLAQQFFDQSEPIPIYDLPSILANEGVPPEEIDDAIKGITQNDPLPGLPHWDHGLDNQEPPSQAVDPVDIFAGCYMSTVTDVQIPSRGFPLQLTRFYRSGPAYFGPWGYNWDHNYNVYLRELKDGSATIWTGHLSEHVYRPRAEGGFEPPTGIFRQLERQAASGLTPDRYILIDRGGSQQSFTRPEGWPHPDRIPLVRLEDRHGNAHQLTYDAEGRLERVEDHAGRYIQFIYGDCGLLEQVTDHTGRVWRYTHDPEVEHLIAVTTPSTPDHPEGLTTYYEYDHFREHPALIHNLIRVIDPAGQVVVENQYGDDPDTADFGRVVYQEFAGFEATFHATRLQYVPRVPDAINVPALRVEVVDPGVLHVYTFNYRGNLLDERFRLSQDGSYRLVARIYRYDEQGNLIEQREPNGLGLLYTYDHENPDPRARGNLLHASLSAPPSRPAPGRDIASMTYETRYQRIRTITDESGDTTRFVYDYEETPVDRGNVIRIESPTVTLPDGISTQEIREHLTYNDFGQLISRQSGEGHLFSYEYYEDAPAVGYLKRTVPPSSVEDVAQEFSYDLYGNVSAVAQTPDSVTEFEYNVLGQLVRSQQSLVNGERGETIYHYGRDGRLQAQDTPRGSYQDDVIAEPYIRHEFDFDVLGHLRSMTYGVNTARPRKWQFKRNAEGLPLEIVDPLGRKTHIDYDERNQPLKQTLFVGTDEERTVRFIYERNGPLSRVIDPLGQEVEYRYDSWDRQFEVKLPGPEATRTGVIQHYIDCDRIERIETIGVPAPGELPTVLEEIQYEYDELGRTVRQIQGAIQNELWYDRDSCLVRTVDWRGNTVSLTCDALGRIRTVTDPLGNSAQYTFDQRGNLTAIDEFEYIPGRPDPEMYHVSRGYDARNRLISTTDPLGNTLTAEYDDRNLMIAAITPLGDRSEYEYDLDSRLVLTRSFVGDPPIPVEHHWQLDLGGRVEVYTDPEGQQTRYTYGLDDQWSQITIPDGRVRQRFFNAGGQLIREVAPSGTEVVYTYGSDGLLERTHFVAGPGVAVLPDLRSIYDGLGRPVRLSQGDVTHDLEYDRFGRLTRETLLGRSAHWTYDDINSIADLTYPDGRVDRHQFDALGRLSTITLHQLADVPLTGPTLTAGSLLAQYEYAGLQRLLSRVLGNGCQTHYTYDRGQRLSGINHRDASDNPLALVQYVYDAMGRRRVMRAEPIPGQSAVYDYDQLSRLRQAAEGITAPEPPLNATQEEADAYVEALRSVEAQQTYEYSLDRADTRTQKILTEVTETTTETYGRNDLHQITELTCSTASTTSTHALTYDLDGRRTGDDRYTYTYDVLGRLTEVREVGTGNVLLRQSYDPLGRVLLRTWESGQIERLRYMGDRLLQHETETGELIRQHCFGMNIDELIAQSHGEEQWGHQDARLSLIALSDSTGNAIERYSYTPFGIPTIWAADGSTPRTTSSFAMPPIFGGHRSLTLNGLYDARARVYDAAIGNFLQRDPRGYGDSPNPYTYIMHNPIDLVDPMGRWIESAWDAFSLGLGIYSFQDNVRRGNVGGAVLDALGILVDTAALILPIVPAGAGVAIKAFRAGFALADFTRVGNRVMNSEELLRYGQRLDRVIRSGQAVNAVVNVGQGGYRAYEQGRQGNWGTACLNASIALLGARGVATRVPVLTGHRTMGGNELVTRFRGSNAYKSTVDIAGQLDYPIYLRPSLFRDLSNRFRHSLNSEAIPQPRPFVSVTRNPFVARGFQGTGNVIRFQVRRADLVGTPSPFHLLPLGGANLYEAEQLIRQGTRIVNAKIAKIEWSDLTEIPITWLERGSIYGLGLGVSINALDALIPDANAADLDSNFLRNTVSEVAVGRTDPIALQQGQASQSGTPK